MKGKYTDKQVEEIWAEGWAVPGTTHLSDGLAELLLDARAEVARLTVMHDAAVRWGHEMEAERDALGDATLTVDFRAIKREERRFQAACAAMQGLLTTGSYSPDRAVDYADALLKALDNPE